MLQQQLLSNLTHAPTGDQVALAGMFEAFFNDTAQRKTFLLRGYAGTGKTTFINALARTMSTVGYHVVLLAPTGRAAKVMSSYSGLEALTIHKKIYMVAPEKTGGINITLNNLNRKPNTIYIVDEASMISNQAESGGLFGDRSLLHDLFSYVYDKQNCMLVLSGDTAQLPPVNETESKSLDPAFIGSIFHTKVYHFEMKEVVRQARESGILMNATALRMLVRRKENFPVLKSEGFADVSALYGNDAGELIMDKYGGRFEDEVLIVCRSNRQANKYNHFIRMNVLGREEEISSGDSLMVVRNNYHWLEESAGSKFIANGDIIRIKRILKREEKFGFHFASAIIRLVDYADEADVEALLLLDTITSETPALSAADSKRLFNEVAQTYVSGNKINYKKVYQDPYLHALQVKFSYAVTCHKAQGGQWNEVLVDPGYMSEEMYNPEFLRWLYTAATRARQKLYFVNVDEKFFRKQLA